MNELLSLLRLVTVKARIVKLVKDNELNIKIGLVRYMFASTREQLVR